MKELATRMLFYGFGIVIAIACLFATAFRFYQKHTDMRAGAKHVINCEVRNFFILAGLFITSLLRVWKMIPFFLCVTYYY